MSQKRGRAEKDAVESKAIRSGGKSEAMKKPVSEFGTEAQRRAGATQLVSPDAVRFIPPQVIRKKGHPT